MRRPVGIDQAVAAAVTSLQRGNEIQVDDAESATNATGPIQRMELFMDKGADPKNVADLPNVAEAMKFASSNRFRTPLRDLAASVLPYLMDEKINSDPKFIGKIVDIISLTGKGMVFFQELFDFLLKNRDKLTGSQTSVLIYECGRHGLRSKHYLDILTKDSRSKVSKMSAEDVSRALMGVCKFSTDYRDFVAQCAKKLDYSKLRPEETLVAIRAFRPAGLRNDLYKLFKETQWSKFTSQVDKMNAIHLLKKARKHPFGSNGERVAESVVIELVRGLGNCEIGPNVIVTDISDCLDSMASWRIRDENLLKQYMDFLTSRAAEIRYSPICGLWQAITDSCGHLGYFHGEWMRMVEDIASSEFNLKGFATFQLIFFISSLGRLNFFSSNVFEAVASVVSGDISAVKDMDMLATLIYPFERSGMKCDRLVNSVLGQACWIIESSSSHADKRSHNQTEAIKILHSCVVLGADPQDEKVRKIQSFISSGVSKNLSPQEKTKLKMLVNLGFFTPDLYPPLVQEDTIPFVQSVQSDGSVVVMEPRQEPFMTWKYPHDHKSYELIQVETNGLRQVILNFLAKKGYSKVEFIV
jgi:hypothetical protein